MKFFIKSKISENIAETPEGYLVCLGVPIGRTGSMDYAAGETPLETGSNGVVKVSRDEADVFNPETIASFQGKSITIGHPDDMVSPADWKELTVGIIQNVRRGEGDQKDDLIADLMITDESAIALVKGGLREVSCGYDLDWEQTGEGTGAQRNIVGNHLALVEEGRAGPSYAINDQKWGKGNMPKNKLKEKFDAIFGKARDEAMSLVGDEGLKTDTTAKPAEPKAADGEITMDAVMDAIKGIQDMMSKMGNKDASTPQDPMSGTPAKPEAEDAEEDMGARMSKLEAAVAKILESMGAGDADEEEEGDADEEDDDDGAGDSAADHGLSNDEVARIEILAPGMKLGKDAKSAAIKAAYGTTEGKRVIDLLTGKGKMPAMDSVEKTHSLFVAASEVLKASRTEQLAGTKKGVGKPGKDESFSEGMTPEKLNEKNEAFWANRK